MIPQLGEIEVELLKRYGGGGDQHTGKVFRQLAEHFQLTPQELRESDGSHPRFRHMVHSLLARHKTKGLLKRGERGKFCYLPEKVPGYEPQHRAPQTPKPANKDKQSIAEDILALAFSAADKERMRTLAAKARTGTQRPDEQAESEAYSRISSLLGILKSKARRLLKGGGTNGKVEA